MPMIETDSLALCECCALLIANGDESGCRDYYGHTHRSADVPATRCSATRPTSRATASPATAAASVRTPYAHRLWSVVLQPSHVLTYRADISDWWCEDCQTVADYCQQINPH